MGDDAFIIPPELKGTDFETKYKTIMAKVFGLYNEMTREKEGELRGRGSGPEKYVHGIPIEDGRYILPLATTSNIFVTMPGNKAINFSRLMMTHPQEEVLQLGRAFIEAFDRENVSKIIKEMGFENEIDEEYLHEFFKPMLDKIDKNVVLFDSFGNPIQRVALGGITSTNPKSPSEVYAKWEPEWDEVNDPIRFSRTNEWDRNPNLKERFLKFYKAKEKQLLDSIPDESRQFIKLESSFLMDTALKEWIQTLNPNERARVIAERILGYGHESISEHSRESYGSEQSLTSYHQFERHRLPENYREPFEKIPVERDVFIPPTILGNKEMLDKYTAMVQEIKAFRQELIDAGMVEAASYLLLNADGVKVITGTNARIDKQMLEQRICNNAQWEIRDRAVAILDLVRENVPYLYDRAGPPCTKGKCPEGALSCGKSAEMREKYGYFGKK